MPKYQLSTDLIIWKASGVFVGTVSAILLVPSAARFLLRQIGRTAR